MFGQESDTIRRAIQQAEAALNSFRTSALRGSTLLQHHAAKRRPFGGFSQFDGDHVLERIRHSALRD